MRIFSTSVTSKMLLYISFVLFIIVKITPVTYSACYISINNDLNKPQPLLIKVEDGQEVFPSPIIGSDKISFHENENVEAYCPGGSVLVSNKSINSNSLFAKCVNGNFVVNNYAVQFYSISCSQVVKDSARFTEKTCLNNYKEFEIGFQYKTKFLTLIKGCFSSVDQNTLYTASKLSKTIDGYQSGYPRSSYWTQGPFYDISGVENLYNRSRQRFAINTLVGLKASSTKYISDDSRYYLCRGHLTPKADFLFGTQQKATFYLINASPQWQIFNCGNWKILEADIRNLASSRRIDLQVYTGTSGILQFPHECTKKLTELYLYIDQNTKKIPIPKYIWKVIYHAESKAGVAFIGVNNPYIKDIKEYTICESICHELNYLSLSPNYQQKGYVYCCKIDNLRKAVRDIPRFAVKKVLL